MRKRATLQVYDQQARRVVTFKEEVRYVYAAVSQNKLVQVVITAVISALLPLVVPVVENGDLDAFNSDFGKALVFAAVGAAARAVVLYVNKPS